MQHSSEDIFTLRWGILGAGRVAASFCGDLSPTVAQFRGLSKIRHVIQAIGSSSIEKAEIFARQSCPWASPHLYATYEALLRDNMVDIVYIATPHACHLENALAAIDAGKHVLVEKPMAINSRQAVTMVERARAKGVYLVEGMGLRFFEVCRQLQTLLYEEKILGNIHRMVVDFGLYLPFKNQPPESRMVDVKLGAGCLLDIGVYPLTWARMIAQANPLHPQTKPSIVSVLSINKGTDEMCSVIFKYPQTQVQAICTASFLHKSAEDFARIEGDKGTIYIYGITSRPQGFRVELFGKTTETHDFSMSNMKGFFFEADSVAKDLQNGRLESSIMPLDESIYMMELLDQIRASGGVVYPEDTSV
ncbi:NAD(P)-binding protein [Trichoderma sp. SZMC 28011]